MTHNGKGEERGEEPFVRKWSERGGKGESKSQFGLGRASSFVLEPTWPIKHPSQLSQRIQPSFPFVSALLRERA